MEDSQNTKVLTTVWVGCYILSCWYHTFPGKSPMLATIDIPGISQRTWYLYPRLSKICDLITGLDLMPCLRWQKKPLPSHFFGCFGINYQDGSYIFFSM